MKSTKRINGFYKRRKLFRIERIKGKKVGNITEFRTSLKV